MQGSYLRRLCEAFFKLDMTTLRAMCKDSALSQASKGPPSRAASQQRSAPSPLLPPAAASPQVRSVAAARALEGLEFTGHVLHVQVRRRAVWCVVGAGRLCGVCCHVHVWSDGVQWQCMGCNWGAQ